MVKLYYLLYNITLCLFHSQVKAKRVLFWEKKVHCCIWRRIFFFSINVNDCFLLTVYLSLTQMIQRKEKENVLLIIKK